MLVAVTFEEVLALGGGETTTVASDASLARRDEGADSDLGVGRVGIDALLARRDGDGTLDLEEGVVPAPALLARRDGGGGNSVINPGLRRELGVMV